MLRFWILSPNRGEVVIHGANLKSGLYFATLETPIGIETLKLIKK